MVNTQDTKALNALKSHIDRGDVPFQGIAKTPEAALKVIGDVLKSPTRLAVTGNTIDVFNAKNQGVRFRITGEFVGFLNGLKGTQK